MGLFGWLKDEDGPDIYDEDEYDELLTDSALYFEAQKLESVCFSVSPKDVFRLDTDAVLESARAFNEVAKDQGTDAFGRDFAAELLARLMQG